MSGLFLSLVGNRVRREDGYLRLGDIYKLKLSADLVVLSSCDSALGKDLDSEGIVGLLRVSCLRVRTVSLRACGS